MLNAEIGKCLPADKIKGRMSLIEPVYVNKELKAHDRNDGTWWLLEVHIPDMFQGRYARPAGSKMPDFSVDNVTSALLIGNEDCPDEIWLTLASPVNYNSRFWRVK